MIQTLSRSDEREAATARLIYRARNSLCSACTVLLVAAEQGREDLVIIGMTHMLRHDAEHGVMTMFEMLVDAFTSLLWDERECLLDAWKSKCRRHRPAGGGV